jgi:hypothetical protein
MPPLLVVPSSTHLEIELMRHPAIELEFESSRQEEQYQCADLSLATQIEAAVCAQFPTASSDELLFASLDWWPNKSRSIVLSERAFSAAVVERLASLLHDKYADWRIHVTVCKALEPEPDESELGTLCIMSGRVIIESSLSALLTPQA